MIAFQRFTIRYSLSAKLVCSSFKGYFTYRRFFLLCFKWYSGQHIHLTHKRSPVQDREEMHSQPEGSQACIKRRVCGVKLLPNQIWMQSAVVNLWDRSRFLSLMWQCGQHGHLCLWSQKPCPHKRKPDQRQVSFSSTHLYWTVNVLRQYTKAKYKERRTINSNVILLESKKNVEKMRDKGLL